MPYSTRFFIGEVTTSGELLYTVPGAYVAVMRDLEVYNVSGVADNGQLSVAPSPGSTTYVVWKVNELPANDWDQWQGRIVMNAGDTVKFEFITGPWHVTLSGYLLSSP